MAWRLLLYNLALTTGSSEFAVPCGTSGAEEEVCEMKTMLMQHRQGSGRSQRLKERRGELLAELAHINTEMSSGSCTDADSNCGAWAQAGFCNRNDGQGQWMKENCMSSCNLCGGGESCVDKNEYCGYWSSIGQCTDPSGYLYMRENCARSCGTCGGEPAARPTPRPTPEPTPLPTPDPNCMDASQYASSCAYWVSIGECTNNNGWMVINCKKSCGACSETGSDTGHEVNGDTPNLPFYHGFAWNPAPRLTKGDLPNDDYMMDGASPLWNQSGRYDLAVMKALGANMVRLYGNDPQWSHHNFLEEAHKLGLEVIVGMSDWPFNQMQGSCVQTEYLCYDQLYASYKANLETGGFLSEDKHGYHPALSTVIVVNEPELKFGNTGAETIDNATNRQIRCKILASAWDAMLQVEKDLEVTGHLVHFTMTFSFAQFLHPVKKPALGQMEYWLDCVRDPWTEGRYQPKNNLLEAYKKRWLNSFNTQLWASGVKGQFLQDYGKSVFWQGSMRIPVFIGEYHAIDKEAGDIESDLKELTDYEVTYPFFKGFAFFEFTRAYWKGDNDQECFGMFDYGEREINGSGPAWYPGTDNIFVYFGNNYSVRCLKPRKVQLKGGQIPPTDQTMVSAFMNIFAKTPLGAAETAVLNEAICSDGVSYGVG